jgi:hypothetical protein
MAMAGPSVNAASPVFREWGEYDNSGQLLQQIGLKGCGDQQFL